MKIIRACLFDGEGKGGGPLALPWLLVPVTRVIALMLRHLKTRKWMPLALTFSYG